MISVDISKNNIYYNVKINSNKILVKNSDAKKILLSKEVVIRDDKALVPIEFITSVLQEGFYINEREIIVNDQKQQAFSQIVGEIVNINKKDDIFKITIAKVESSNPSDIINQTVFNISDETIFQNPKLEIGDKILGITSLAMTRSFPPQTHAYVIYKI